MKKTSLVTSVAFLLLLAWTNSCKSPSSADQPSPQPLSSSGASSGSTSLSSTGFLQLILKDKPIPEAKNIWVKINKIQVHKATDDDASFITVYESAAGMELDLLVLKTTPTTLFTAILAAGKYTQIRLSVISGKIVFAQEGEPDAEFPLDIPSDELKVPVQFEILAETTTAIKLDFDAEKSIHVVKKGKNDSYLLRPVIQVEGVQQGA